MSITAVNSNSTIYPTNPSANAKQVRADFQNLTDALQSGDLASAQQAFAALQKDDPQVAKALAQSDQTGSNPQVGALQSLATALQSGSVPAAQTAFASLQQALKGHRGHHRQAAPAATAPSTPANAGAASGADNDGDNDNSGATRATLLNAIA